MSAARGAAEALFSLAQNRIELFSVELQEEKLRAASLAVWLTAGLVLGAAGLLLAIAAAALWVWERAGCAGVAGLALAVCGAGAGVLWSLRRRIRNSPLPFAQTAAEFRKDRECLSPPP